MVERKHGPQVTPEEVWKFASGKPCCNGRGYTDTIVTGIGVTKDQEKQLRRDTCSCAARRFFRAHPMVIVDSDGHAWWPAPGDTGPTDAPPDATRDTEPGDSADGAPEPDDAPDAPDDARRREQIDKLTRARATLQTTLDAIDQRIALICEPELNALKELQRQREGLHANLNRIRTEITDAATSMKQAEVMMQELREKLDAIDDQRNGFLVAGNALIDEETTHVAALADLDGEEGELRGDIAAKEKKERLRNVPIKNKIEQLDRRISRIAARLPTNNQEAK